MSRSDVTASVVQRKPKASGAEIRARIDANARKRRLIAEQMKREAGVRGHVENRTEMSGLAWTNTGCIETPESRNITNLYVLAHECGHVFLHMTGVGRLLPPHVMEYEAECYAHQALRHHGMNVPLMHTTRARRYVAAMIDQDRARNLPISPVAERFSQGFDLPYAPLRTRPKTWHDKRPPATLDDLYPAAVAGILREMSDKHDKASYEARERHIHRYYLYPFMAVALGVPLVSGRQYIFIDQPLLAVPLALYLAGRASIDWIDRIVARRKVVRNFLRERDRPTTSHIQLSVDSTGKPVLRQVRSAP